MVFCSVYSQQIKPINPCVIDITDIFAIFVLDRLLRLISTNPISLAVGLKNISIWDFENDVEVTRTQRVTNRKDLINFISNVVPI